MISESMRLATDCLKEFMAGYRKGRDEEVDKMLHKYFQELNWEEDPVTDDTGNNTAKVRRRKPKRAQLRN